MGKRRKRKRRKKVRLVEERVGSHPDRIRLKVYDKIGLVRDVVAVNSVRQRLLIMDLCLSKRLLVQHTPAERWGSASDGCLGCS